MLTPLNILEIFFKYLYIYIYKISIYTYINDYMKENNG